jgi:hypothetical protein
VYVIDDDCYLLQVVLQMSKQSGQEGSGDLDRLLPRDKRGLSTDFKSRGSFL